jgi:hypothetical protein
VLNVSYYEVNFFVKCINFRFRVCFVMGAEIFFYTRASKVTLGPNPSNRLRTGAIPCGSDHGWTLSIHVDLVQKIEQQRNCPSHC